MSLDPAHAAGQRKAIALVTALHAHDGDSVRGQIDELADAGELVEVLVAVACAHVGMLRAVAARMAVSPEYLIQRSALYWQDPPA